MRTAGQQIVRLLRRCLDVLQREGARAFLFRALAVTCYRRLVLLECCPERMAPSRQDGRSWQIAQLAAEDAPRYLALRQGARLQRFHERLAAGHRCFVAMRHGQLLHAGWVAAGSAELEYLGQSLQLEPGTAYFYSAYTAPGRRREGIARSVRCHAAVYLAERGVQRILAAVLPENRGGDRYLRRLGFRPVALLARLRLGPLRLPLRRRLGRPRSGTG